MKTLLRKIGTKGFTLIEILTVVSIIGILAGLLFPVIQAARRKAKVVQSQSDVKNIETAFKGYYTEYGKWPVGINDNLSSNVTYFVDSNMVALLQGFDNTASVTMESGGQTATATLQGNPRRISFLELRQQDIGTLTASGSLSYCPSCFVDPWKQPYRFRMDVGYYNSIADPYVATSSGKTINRGSLIWSSGPDLLTDQNGDNDGPNKDNINSW